MNFKKIIIGIGILGLLSFSDSIQVGEATYYSSNFEGRKTASGDIFRQSKLTGASNTFDLGSIVSVTDLSTGKTVIVVINDRMSIHSANKGRVIDLSKSSAKKIGLLQKGITKVIVKLL